jgi:hypothetical protein
MTGGRRGWGRPWIAETGAGGPSYYEGEGETASAAAQDCFVERDQRVRRLTTPPTPSPSSRIIIEAGSGTSV